MMAMMAAKWPSTQLPIEVLKLDKLNLDNLK